MLANPRLLARTAVAAALAAVALRAIPPADGPALAQSPWRCAMPSAVIEGTVTQKDGSPAAGAQVAAKALTAAGQHVVVASALADAHGVYRLERFCPSTYRVDAQLLTSAGVLSGAYDGDDDGTPDDVALTELAPTATGIDIVLDHGPVPPAATSVPVHPTSVPQPTVPPPSCAISDGIIRGTVTGPDGQPIEGAQVYVRGRTAAGSAPPATTAADGTYAIEGLCEGSYYVAASVRLADGTVLSGAYPDAVVLTEQARVAEPIDIVLGVAHPPAPQPTAPPHPPTAVPTHPAPLPGSSCRAGGSAAGSTTNAAGAPIDGATVRLVPQRATAAGPAPVTVESDADGRWAAHGVCPGHYVILATKVTADVALAGVLDADDDGRPDLITVSVQTPDHAGLEVVLRDLLAPVLSPFAPAGRAWPSGHQAR